MDIWTRQGAADFVQEVRSVDRLRTSDTEPSRSKAACLAKSSGSEPAVATAGKPERPAVARIVLSHDTDSVPTACRFRTL